MIDTFQSGIKDDYSPDTRVFNSSVGTYDGYVITISDFMHPIQVEQLTKGTPAIISIDTKEDLLLQKIDRMEVSITREIHDLRTDLRSDLDLEIFYN